MTMTLQTGAFAVPALALGVVDRDRTSGPSASALGSGLVPTAACTASAWIIADVPTPVPVRYRGAHG